MKQKAPIEILVHGPQSPQGRQELARGLALVHADCVIRTIRGLDCPAGQKRELLRSVLDAARSGSRSGRPEQREP